MYSTHKSTRRIGLALTTAVAGALLAGCTANVAPVAEVSAAQAQDAIASGRHQGAVQHAEAAVLADPRNVNYRGVLGQAYLDAGRFAAAQASFDDAMELGDSSPRTALSLALALTAQAKYSEAAALLNDWEAHIATADLGLALALAGQPQRGIHIMTNAIRGGENTVKMRQNLAYAYALAGRWRDARIMVSQDVPADQVGDRMAQWGAMVHPAAYQQRVAALLGVPAGARDAGQPVQLALANHPTDTQLALEASGSDTAQVAAAPTAIERVAIPASGVELPPVARPAIAAQDQRAWDHRVQPSGQPATTLQSAMEQVGLAQVSAPAAAVRPSPSGVQLAPQSAAQIDPVRYGAPPEPRISGRAAAEGTRPVAQRAVPARSADGAATVTTTSAISQRPAQATASLARTPSSGSHLVQLGSFTSEQSARRAWGIYVSRYPELGNHQMVITEAMVRGKRYFRVSAGGFDRSASRSMCQRVAANGGDGCITWAASSPLPGAVDTGVRLARR